MTGAGAMTGPVLPSTYVPQDPLYVWALVNPAQPVLVGELRLSQLVADCATFTYDAPWWHFALSEDLPIVQGQEFTAGERGSAPGAIDDARPDRGASASSATSTGPRACRFWRSCCSQATTGLARWGYRCRPRSTSPVTWGRIRNCATWPS